MADKTQSNPVGRPPIYNPDKKEDINRVAELCKSYFSTLKETQPPTITGLTLHLGFENKSTLYDYAKKEEFSNPIKKVLTAIEQYHEEATAGGDKCVGNIFVLKNFGWVDSVKTDITTNGKDLPTPTTPTIVFKKYDTEDGD